jgi:hypothetical protein
MRAATLEELSLEPSVQRLISEFADSTGLRVELEIALAANVPLAPELAQALCRVSRRGRCTGRNAALWSPRAAQPYRAAAPGHGGTGAA